MILNIFVLLIFNFIKNMPSILKFIDLYKQITHRNLDIFQISTLFSTFGFKNNTNLEDFVLLNEKKISQYLAFLLPKIEYIDLTPNSIITFEFENFNIETKIYSTLKLNIKVKIPFAITENTKNSINEYFLKNSNYTRHFEKIIDIELFLKFLNYINKS